MPEPGPAAGLRADQQRSWDGAAVAWKKWWAWLESGTEGLNAWLVQRAGVKAGSRALDVATGPGEPALTAAGRVGPSGRVTATDFAPGMLEFAAQRAAELGLHNAEFLQRDAEQLDLEDASFDAATCRFGVMLFVDPRAALAAIRRLLRPGGGFAAAVWGPPEEVPFIRLPREVLAEELGFEPPHPGLDQPPDPLRLGRQGMLEGLLEEAGFVDVTGETLTVVHDLASAREYVRLQQDLSSKMRKELESRPEEVRRRVWDRLEAAARDHADVSGRVRLENTVFVAAGRNPDPSTPARGGPAPSGPAVPGHTPNGPDA